MAKNNLVWFVVLAAVLVLVYYLYEGGSFSEGVDCAYYKKSGCSHLCAAQPGSGGVCGMCKQCLAAGKL